MRKISQNSQASNDKIVQLQHQVQNKSTITCSPAESSLIEHKPYSGLIMFFVWHSLFDWQLEEANDLLRAESDTAARLRKSHTEIAKSMNQLEGLNRELQERSRAADAEKAQLQKEILLLQSTLDSERRNYSQGSEEIRELQGDPLTNANLKPQTTTMAAWPNHTF